MNDGHTYATDPETGRAICDLVLKGGITSGIAFPKAIARLAQQYRFRSIGGASAGAIGAAGAAAAEYRRATDKLKPNAGFESLEQLPSFLGERAVDGRTRLYHLFRPEAASRRHFKILTSVLNRKTVSDRIFHGSISLIAAFPLASILGALPGGFLALAAGGASWHGEVSVILATLIAVAGAVSATIFACVTSLAHALSDQNFGLSYGHHDQKGNQDTPALTDWLHRYLQEIAGKDHTGPLTFGDLASVTLDASRGIEGIELRMMTTAISMGRPFSIPFDTQQFYFREEELKAFFPEDVVNWMVNQPGERWRKNLQRDAAMKSFGYRPLPAKETLPVLVATRLSLSFPILLSAVPLYRYAWEAGIADQVRPLADEAQSHTPDHIHQVLFSDGGICSNFPVHMFDSILPNWPTFGINLRDDLKSSDDDSRRAYLPGPGVSLPPEDYRSARTGFSATATFFIGIIKTMQNWHDNLQRAAPGFRDRIVTIRHTVEEGGLNLDMHPDTIGKMSESGTLAAGKLIEAFAPSTGASTDSFVYHRWVRARSLLAVLQGGLREIHTGVTSIDNTPPYPDLILNSTLYVSRSYPLSSNEKATAVELLDAMSKLDGQLASAPVDFQKNQPRPEVELRIQPIY